MSGNVWPCSCEHVHRSHRMCLSPWPSMGAVPDLLCPGHDHVPPPEGLTRPRCEACLLDHLCHVPGVRGAQFDPAVLNRDLNLLVVLWAVDPDAPGQDAQGLLTNRQFRWEVYRGETRLDALWQGLTAAYDLARTA